MTKGGWQGGAISRRARHKTKRVATGSGAARAGMPVDRGAMTGVPSEFFLDIKFAPAHPGVDLAGCHPVDDGVLQRLFLVAGSVGQGGMARGLLSHKSLLGIMPLYK